MNLKTTTLRQLIIEDIDKAFSLDLCYFCNYDRVPNLVTTKQLAPKFNKSNGHYGPYEMISISKGFIDFPLYLGEE